MNSEQCDVGEFHRAMDQRIESRPTVPSEKIVRLRARLVAEEFGEFLCAITGNDDQDFEKLLLDLVDALQFNEPDLPAMADAVIDLKYVLEGTLLAFGIDGEPIWNAVHAANMKKAGGPVGPDGKRLKPPGWVPPDVRQLLIDQGWTPPEGS
jgi:predicted HAD superfamily Cof-like phosphohydrolase